MKLFDFLCQELSVLSGVPVIGATRYDLWLSMAEHNAHPVWLTNEQAVQYLRAGQGRLIARIQEKASQSNWEDLLKRIEKFNPEVKTPEEVFERLGR